MGFNSGLEGLKYLKGKREYHFFAWGMVAFLVNITIRSDINVGEGMRSSLPTARTY
jgi:hypothetical protein